MFYVIQQQSILLHPKQTPPNSLLRKIHDRRFANQNQHLCLSSLILLSATRCLGLAGVNGK